MVLQNLRQKQNGKYILGVNINTNYPADEELARAEITDLYSTFSEYADYYTINWGSIAPEILSSVLIAVADKKKQIGKPIFLKLPADVPIEKLDDIISFARQHHIDGFIATGPSQDRSLLIHSSQAEVTHVGAGGYTHKGCSKRKSHSRYVR